MRVGRKGEVKKEQESVRGRGGVAPTVIDAPSHLATMFSDLRPHLATMFVPVVCGRGSTAW